MGASVFKCRGGLVYCPALMNAPLVYVLVINWNGREHLDACFESLLASTYANAVFLLVDNASDDDSVARVKSRYGHDARVAVLALDRNRGWSGGNNAGIQHALEQGAAYILLLNNDTAVDAACLTNLVDGMERRPDCGALAPRMLLFDQPCLINSIGLELSLTGSAWDRGIGRADTPEWHVETPVAGACGGACFLRAPVLEETGLLPEEFEIYYDDLDLCLRIWTAGYTIWTCPSAVVRHKFSATMGAGPRARRKYYLNTRNRFRVVARHFPIRAMGAILSALAVGECRALGRALIEGQFPRIWAHIRAWLSAFLYLPRAVRFRTRASRSTGIPPFWPLVRNYPLFCPHVVLPENGWYAPIEWRGELICPMALGATLTVPAGPLRLSLVNCYPHLGSVEVRVTLNRQPLDRLHSVENPTATHVVESGELQLHASTIFLASDTGAPADIGAWFQIFSRDKPLV